MQVILLVGKKPASSEVQRYVFGSLLKHQLTRDNIFGLIRPCGNAEMLTNLTEISLSAWNAEMLLNLTEILLSACDSCLPLVFWMCIFISNLFLMFVISSSQVKNRLTSIIWRRRYTYIFTFHTLFSFFTQRKTALLL